MDLPVECVLQKGSWMTVHRDRLLPGSPETSFAKIRYLGVGAMVVGGIWSVIQLAKPLIESIQLSLKTLGENSDNISLEERDLLSNYVFIAILAMLIPISLMMLTI